MPGVTDDGTMIDIHTLFHGPPGLAGRRRQWQLRRALAALFAGIATWCALQCVMATVRTRPVLVTAHALQPGDAIDADDVTVLDMPDHAALDAVLHEPAQAAGSLAAVAIGAGDLLTPALLNDTPSVPPGHTVIDVRLGELQHPFALGTKVRLTAAVGCDSPTDQGCTVSDDAMVMGTAAQDGLIAMAMPAADAMRTLDVQAQAPIIAVRAP